MIKIFKTFGGYVEINEPQKGCWINTTNAGQTCTTKTTSRWDFAFSSLDVEYGDILRTQRLRAR